MEKVAAGWLRGGTGETRQTASLRESQTGAVMPVEKIEDEQQILALHEAGDKALMSVDLAALAQIFADDYVQYNESGKAFTKQDVLNNFRSGAILYPSIVSTGRKIRVFGDTAVVHGSESDEVEADGKTFSVRYVYLDVLRKKDGAWKLVASQLARPME
jgi:uncharacterized protein (TIGR02246 family)